jgi:hypothetical protein
MIGWYCTLHQLTKKKTNSFARKNYLHILGFPDWFTAAYSSLFFLRLKTCEPFLSMPVFGITVASWIILDSRPAQCAAARNGMILLGWPATVYLCCWVANSAIGIEKALAGLALSILEHRGWSQSIAASCCHMVVMFLIFAVFFTCPSPLLRFSLRATTCSHGKIWLSWRTAEEGESRESRVSWISHSASWQLQVPVISNDFQTIFKQMEHDGTW